jgi:hypothetical protein
MERSRRRQASRLVWLKEGDTCTWFFHLRANGRSRKNFIPVLKDDNTRYVWGHEEKEHILYGHFQKIMGTKEQRQATLNWLMLEMPRLIDHQLDAPFTEVEIKRIVMELPVEKAPGSDGFTGLFYQTC